MASDAGPLLTFQGGGTLDAGVPSGISNPAPLLHFKGGGTLDAEVFRDPGADVAWTARLTDTYGAMIALLPTATWGPITSVHNQPVTVSGVTVSAADPNLSTLLTDNTIHELQLWWGPHMVFSGPISRPRYQNGTFTFDAADVMEYLKRRVVGSEETNELADPDFALYPWLGGYSSWGDWYVHKSNRGGGSVWVDYGEFYPVSAPVMAGAARSMQLHNDDNDPDVFLEFLQSGNLTAGEFPLKVAFVAYVQLGAAPSGYTATQGHGMALGMYTGSLADYQATVWPTPLGMQSDGGIWEETSTAAISATETPRGDWVRLETSVTVPPGETRLVIAEISCPDGETVTIAQHPRVVTSEGLEFKGKDIAQVIAGLAAHAQDTAFGKSDLNYEVGEVTALHVGVAVDRVYPFAEHRNIWQAITEFTAESADIWAQEHPTSRSIHVNRPRGKYKRQLRLEVRPNGGNCELVSWTSDTERAANRLFHMGAGSGIGRDVGYAKDTTAHGGITLESVDYADPLLSTGDLELTARATDRLKSLIEPELLVLRTFAGEGLWRFIKYVNPGDWLPVRVYVLADDGITPIFDIAADYQVASKTLDANDVVLFNLNRRDVPDALL